HAGSPAVPLGITFRARPPTASYSLSLHDALPIFDEGLNRSDVTAGATHAAVTEGVPLVVEVAVVGARSGCAPLAGVRVDIWHAEDRKSTRLNSSHSQISYAVFCLKKKISPLKKAL